MGNKARHLRAPAPKLSGLLMVEIAGCAGVLGGRSKVVEGSLTFLVASELTDQKSNANM